MVGVPVVCWPCSVPVLAVYSVLGREVGPLVPALGVVCCACGVPVGVGQCAPPGGGTIGSGAGAGWDCWRLSYVGCGQRSQVQNLQPTRELALRQPAL